MDIILQLFLINTIIHNSSTYFREKSYPNSSYVYSSGFVKETLMTMTLSPMYKVYMFIK
jgi:hypothetical protein